MMNLRKMKTAMAALAVVAMVFTACSGEDGGDGPAGANGANGADGNANVGSTNYSVASSDWSMGAIKRDTLSVAAITKDVVDNGTVQVFQSTSTNSDSLIWAALPHNEVIGVTTTSGVVAVTIMTQFEYFVGSVYLSVSNSQGFNITNSANFPGDRTFKVVVIPSGAKVDGVNLNDYEAVKAVYGIQEFDM